MIRLSHISHLHTLRLPTPWNDLRNIKKTNKKKILKFGQMGVTLDLLSFDYGGGVTISLQRQLFLTSLFHAGHQFALIGLNSSRI